MTKRTFILFALASASLSYMPARNEKLIMPPPRSDRVVNVYDIPYAEYSDGIVGVFHNGEDFEGNMQVTFSEEDSYTFAIYFVSEKGGEERVYRQDFEAYGSSMSFSIPITIPDDEVPNGESKFRIHLRRASDSTEAGYRQTLTIEATSPLIVTEGKPDEEYATGSNILYMKGGHLMAGETSYRLTDYEVEQSQTLLNYPDFFESGFSFLSLPEEGILESPEIELRLYTCLDDFSIGEIVKTGVSGGDYRRFPLRVISIFDNFYIFRLEKEYAFDPFTLKMSELEAWETSSYRSDVLLIPTGIGHNQETYQFSLVLSGLTVGNDFLSYPLYFSRGKDYVGSRTNGNFYISCGRGGL